MYRSQRGLSVVVLLVIVAIIIIGAVGGMKIGPAYVEYFMIKKAVATVALEGKAASVADVRKGFDRRAQIDEISVIDGKDLEVFKDGNEIVVSFAYPKKVPLFGNVSLLIEFSGASNQ